MRESIVWNPIDVQNEIGTLGLDFNLLVECVRYAEHERSFVTDNDAIGFASMVVYDKLGRALREKFLPKGWVKDDSHNQCAIRNPSLKIRVVPCNFDEAAGNRLLRPTNKSPKGEVSRKKSVCNMTAWLPGVPKGEPVDDGFQTWVLGVFTDDQKPTTAELSLPIGFDGHHYTDFGQRIMLITGAEDDKGPARRSGDDSGNDAVEVVDIAVRRK